jgi:hypothetical protein
MANIAVSCAKNKVNWLVQCESNIHVSVYIYIYIHTHKYVCVCVCACACACALADQSVCAV